VFSFDSSDARVEISNEDTIDGVVIADAVMFVSMEHATPAPVQSIESAEKLAELKANVDQLQKALVTLQKSAPRRPTAMAAVDHSKVGDIHLAIRGVVSLPGPLIPRGVLQVAAGDSMPVIPTGQSGRRELAAWITDTRNPLPARVFANRIWYWLMGRGIVASVDNFGSMGDRPTHPELLDHLATSLTTNGWSTKSLIREIVLSNTYRMSSIANRQSAELDPDNRLFTRMNRKRFRAEDIRDSLLAVAGMLDARQRGPNIKPGTTIEYDYKFDSARRSVYEPVFRNTLPEIFEVFDFADPNSQRGQRSTSTVASQALMLMNHPWVNEQAHAAAKLLLSSDLPHDNARIEAAFVQVLGRNPSSAELAVAVDLITSIHDNESVDSWAMLYQVLFQSLDFRYLN
jgi:Protein of unknown function (DUF1553)